MASYPPGLLSFVYHITNDLEINERFSKSEEAVEELLEFFYITNQTTKDIVLETWREYNNAYNISKPRRPADPDTITRAINHLLSELNKELRASYDRVW